jgi:hypothetical protein
LQESFVTYPANQPDQPLKKHPTDDVKKIRKALMERIAKGKKVTRSRKALKDEDGKPLDSEVMKSMVDSLIGDPNEL